MNWRLLTSKTLKESSKEKNTLIVLAMMVVTPFNGYDPFCGYEPSGGYAAFNGYERVWRGYEHGYERIWNPWWLLLTINTLKESAHGESTWCDVDSLYVSCIAMGDWVRGSARGLPVFGRNGIRSL